MTEDPKEIEEVPSTPDRGIPLNVKEKRGCMTSPINKANSRTNMVRLEREWSEMMKIAKETKQKLKGQEDVHVKDMMPSLSFSKIQ